MAVINYKIETNKGVVEGKAGRLEGNKVFLGIPYGKAPVHNLRFMPPVEVDPWEGVKNCQNEAMAPMQSYRPGETFPVSEDCLTVNVYTSAKEDTDKLPVLVWIFGGGFTGGRSNDPEFDGEVLAERGAVVVTINYRVNIFGFFSTTELEERTGKAQNNGILDQQMALRWVKENIERFGGDSQHVMIFGQSAGGVSVRMHLVSEYSKGLFTSAVVESGGGLNEADLVRPKEEFQELCQECLNRVGWTLDDVLTKSAQEVLDTMLPMAQEILQRREVALFQPFVDAYTLKEVPGVSISKGEYHDVPVICGTVAGDSWMFSRKVRAELRTEGQFKGFALSPGQAWGCNQLKRHDKPIRTYYMDRKQPEREQHWSHGAPPFGANTPHGSEIVYLFGTLEVRGQGFEAIDYKIADMMQQYFLNFAAKGDPNGEGLPDWPLFGDEHETLHITDQGIRVENVVSDKDEERAIQYTMEHPGMLSSLENF